jgi:hypothetical protein
LASVSSARAHLLDVVDAHAEEALHGDDAAGGELVDDAWGAHVVVAELFHDAIELVHVRRFAREVELLADGVVEVLDDADGVGQLHRRDQRDDLRHEAEDADVGGGAALDVRALDLDHDAAAVVQARGVDLGDRRRRQRLRVELGVELVGARAQLDGERALDVGVGEGLDAIERLLELLAVGLGEEAVRRGDELAELQVGGAELLEGEAHQLGPDAALAAELAQDTERGVAREHPAGREQPADGGEADGSGAIAAEDGEGGDRSDERQRQRQQIR